MLITLRYISSRKGDYAVIAFPMIEQFGENNHLPVWRQLEQNS
jgi:hypothetical protein